MYFKEGTRFYLSCISEGEAEMRITPQKGKNVTSLMTRCTGKWGVHYYELVAWDEQATAMNNAVREAGLRIIAVGSVPRMDDFWKGKDRVQYKMRVDELFVEDVKKKEFAEVISKNGVPEVEERVYEPIEVPVSIA